jgi:hypothetical protein
MWAHTEPATALALFRIAIGIILLHTVVDVWWTEVEAWVWVDRTDGGVIKIFKGHWLVKMLGGAGLETTHTLMGIVAAASLLMIAGLGHRVAAFVGLQALLALLSMNPLSGGAHDKLLTNALWLLLLAPASETLSLWCRWKRKRWTSARPVAAWPRYLVILQITMTYCFTGLQKLGPSWMPWGDFSAIYYSLLTPTWARWDLVWIAWVFPLTQFGTILTWWWEVTWPVVLLALWFRRTHGQPGRVRALFNRVDVRSIYLLIGVGVHLVIEVALNVGPFSWVSLAFYFCCFHPDEFKRYSERLRRRGGRAPGLLS